MRGGAVIESGEFCPGNRTRSCGISDGYLVEIWDEIPTPVDLGDASAGASRGRRFHPLTMITYEVTASVRADLVPAYEPYMRERHIPALLATGRFHAATFGRSSPGRYRIRYEAADQTMLDRYLAEDAPRLRADVQEHFPDGVELTREVWEAIQVWPAEGR